VDSAAFFDTIAVTVASRLRRNGFDSGLSVRVTTFSLCLA